MFMVCFLELNCWYRALRYPSTASRFDGESDLIGHRLR